MNTSIMLTGATGFIGSYIADALLSNDTCRLITVVREKAGYKNTEYLAGRGALVYTGSFFDYAFIDSIMQDNRIRTIVHCAALRGGGMDSAAAYNEINVRGTEILLEAAVRNGVEKFIFISSVGVHGTIPVKVPAGPDAEFNGDNLYHASKIAAESIVRHYSGKSLDTVILRPTITYGRGDNGFPATLAGLVRRRIFPLPMREVFIHLLDVSALAGLVKTIVTGGRTSGGAYIVADESPIALGNLADTIHQKIYGKPYPRVLHIPTVAYDIMAGVCSGMKNEKWATRFNLISRSWYYNISDTIRSFGFRPSQTLKAFIDVIE
jgi:nucleoside-diphosphate-sugar epimerase